MPKQIQTNNYLLKYFNDTKLQQFPFENIQFIALDFQMR